MNKKTLLYISVIVLFIGFFVSNVLIEMVVRSLEYFGNAISNPENAKFKLPTWDVVYTPQTEHLLGYLLFYFITFGILIKMPARPAPAAQRRQSCDCRTHPAAEPRRGGPGPRCPRPRHGLRRPGCGRSGSRRCPNAPPAGRHCGPVRGCRR